jgi:hypothetical protein
MRKGWFKWPGVQDGDRTLEEQLRGLEPALAACRDMTVLDLGAAECMISAAFARAGAARVTAIEMVPDHVTVGRKVCAGLPVDIIQAELSGYIQDHPQAKQYDIVLALGIAHKLHEPGALLSFAARSCRAILVFRGPGKEKFWDGVLKAKFGGGSCHVPTLLADHGFMEGETLDSSNGERAQYWYRR